jgi:hypothetical protein
MAADHTAVGSAAGYLHQMELALLELVRRANSSRDVSIKVEALDDIELAEDGRTLTIQSKARLSDHNLADRSPDLWKSIAVWIDIFRTVGATKLPDLMLCTTDTCAPDTAVSMLRTEASGTRDVDDARRLLKAVAAEDPGNAGTVKARQAFLDLEESERLLILEAVEILDGTAKTDELDDELRHLIGYAAPSPEQADDLVNQVKGWWQGEYLFLLTTGKYVTGNHFWTFLNSAKRSLDDEVLELDSEIFKTDPDDTEMTSLRQRTFIKQLELVVDSDPMFNLAVRDYWRAREQRSSWTDKGKLLPDEVDDFDRKLREEWEQAYAFMIAELDSRKHVEAERRDAGLELFGSMRNNNTIRLRGDFHDPTITRGSLHGLADTRKIGWHPDFESLLGPA